ncbi:MAG: CBS domain-containing protein [Candidatus Micrarchaeota archaeon]
MKIVPAFTVNEGDSVSKALTLFEKTDFVIVTDSKGKYSGQISALEIGSFTNDASRAKAATRAKKGATASKETLDGGATMRLFAQSGLEGLAIVGKGGIVEGAVTKLCVLEEAIVSAKAMPLTAADAMERIVSVGASEPATAANSLMLRTGAKEIVVIEGTNAIGTVSALDLARKLKTMLRQPFRTGLGLEKSGAQEMQVQAMMEPLAQDAIALGGESLSQVASRMAANGARIVLVQDQGKLRGAVTFHGLLGAICGPAEPKDVKMVEVSGLKGEEKFLKASLQEEAAKALCNISGDARLALHIKGTERRKGKKEYEVHATLETGKKVLNAGTPDLRGHTANWDLHLAVKEVLGELKKRYQKEVKRA